MGQSNFNFASLFKRSTVFQHVCIYRCIHCTLLFLWYGYVAQNRFFFFSLSLFFSFIWNFVILLFDKFAKCMSFQRTTKYMGITTITHDPGDDKIFMYSPQLLSSSDFYLFLTLTLSFCFFNSLVIYSIMPSTSSQDTQPMYTPIISCLKDERFSITTQSKRLYHRWRAASIHLYCSTKACTAGSGCIQIPLCVSSVQVIIYLSYINSSPAEQYISWQTVSYGQSSLYISMALSKGLVRHLARQLHSQAVKATSPLIVPISLSEKENGIRCLSSVSNADLWLKITFWVEL